MSPRFAGDAAMIQVVIDMFWLCLPIVIAAWAIRKMLDIFDEPRG